jgi:type IV pilus assembly protein PilE
MKKIKWIKLKAFTLPELLVVLVIIGILVLIALPNLMPLISRAKGTEAKTQLVHLFNLEKNYFYMYSKYTDDFQQLGFEQEKLVTDGGNANYKIQIVEFSATAFKVRAEAVADFDGDGKFNVWEIDQEKKLVEVVGD